MDDSVEGIAIVGMAGRFPGARDVDTLWRNLRDGVDAITSFSDDELRAAGVPESVLADPAYVKAGPVLDDVELFDADFFGISAHEAELTDPQQRLFLECAWEALEHAGYDADRLDGRVGVFAGAGLNTYLLQLAAARDILNSPDAFQAMLVNDKDYLATRVSYKLNLRGPSISVQTACSTSLVAVHLACQSLLTYHADLALAGGVSITLPQGTGYRYQDGMIFSPDGRCRPFDAAAAGTVGGSGAGLVALKRIADAIADGDTIYAVIRGSAVNNDGAGKIGFTAPSVDGQAEVIAEALALANVDPATIEYVEAHGTGTPLGDPIELAALRRVFGQGRGRGTCALGSLKSNLGHLDTAAGVTGLIKAALALHHRQIPPTLHFQRPNPDLEIEDSPFYVNAALLDWPRGSKPRRAGVSSFGIGGTNAHVVLEEAPAALAAPASAEWGRQLLVVSARTPAALDAASERLASHLRAHPDLDLADVAYTLQTGRRPFPYRRVASAQDSAEAARLLDGADPKRVWGGCPTGEAPAVAFLFPGQGAQHVGMARGLYDALPDFRATVDECAERLQPLLGLDLRAVLFPAPADVEAARQQLTQTALAQPALFTIELALARQWQQWGVVAAALAGHSLGEYVAACLAGVFDEETALALVAQRGRLMQACPSGAMLGLPLPESEVTALLDGRTDRISLAAVNGPSSCVVGGPTDAIERLEADLGIRGITARRLVTSHAFHTPMLEPIVATFAARVAQTARQTPSVPWVSTVTGTWITAEQATSPDYWAQQIRQPVRFGAALATLLDGPAGLLLEVGPGQTLASLARRLLPDRRAAGHPDTPIVGSLRHPDDTSPDLDVLLGGLGRLWLAGVPVDWPAFHAESPRRRVPLPTYPFERRRFWIDAPPRLAGKPLTVDALEVSAAPPPEHSPATPTGRYARPALATAYVAPSTATEQTVAALWQDLLGLDQLGIHDNFLELGGHSLLAGQLVGRLRETFAVDLPIRALFEAPTVATLAERIEQICDEEPTHQLPPITPVSRDGALPLSFAQEWQWAREQVEPRKARYNAPVAMRLHGPLDVGALERSLNEIVRRHEALRTTFAMVDGRPSQIIGQHLPFTLPTVDLQALPETEREIEAPRLVTEAALAPFDPVRGPVFRALLVRLNEHDHVLLLVMHYVVCDGWTWSLFFRELVTLYEAFSTGGSSPLPELSIQYADFAHWQRQWLRDEQLQVELDYWKKQLRGAPPVLELPSDRPRPAVQTGRGVRYHVELPDCLSEALRALSRRHGTTLFMTLMAAFKASIYCYTGQSDLVVGTVVANRGPVETEGLIGLFVNLLALRTDLSNDPTFRELLTRVRERVVEADAHQSLPFETLVQELQLDGDASRSPVFQVMFILDKTSSLPATLPGVTADILTIERGKSDFDLAIALEEGEGITGYVEYSTDLFDEPTVASMFDHFQQVLESVVLDPERRLSDLPPTTAHDHRPDRRAIRHPDKDARRSA